jgi:nitrous oxidase accessory protein
VLVLAGLLSLVIFNWLQPVVPVQDDIPEGVIRPDESIQRAIDGAPEGAVLQLAAGTWQENIRIDRSLTLRGAGARKTIMDGIKEGYPVVWIAAGEKIRVKLEGLTIIGAERGDAAIGADGILIQGEARVSITNASISESRHGILLRDSAEAEITGTTIPGPGEPDGNHHGNIIPTRLGFLMTKEGG